MGLGRQRLRVADPEMGLWIAGRYGGPAAFVHGWSENKIDEGSVVVKTSTAVALATITALAVGLAIGLAIDRRNAVHETDPALAQVLARLEALEAERVPSSRPRASAGYGAIGAASTMSLGRSGLPVPLPRKVVEAAEQQRARAMEARFAGDPRDAAAASVEIKMLKTMTDKQLAAMGETPIDPDVQCRRNSCRITAQFGQADDAMDWALNYVTLLGHGTVSNAQPVLVRNPDGSSQLRLYAARGPER